MRSSRVLSAEGLLPDTHHGGLPALATISEQEEGAEVGGFGPWEWVEGRGLAVHPSAAFHEYCFLNAGGRKRGRVVLLEECGLGIL